MKKQEQKLVPELRFPEFTGEWVETTIKKVCSISTGKSNTQDKVENGLYPFYVRSATIERSNKYLFDEEAVLTVGDGVGTGKVYHYVDGKYDLHQRVYRLFSFKGVTGKFLFYFFSTNFHNRVNTMSAKNSVDSVRMEMIADMPFPYPQAIEQQKIADCLTTLDEKINAQSQKIEQLKAHKKGLTQKLFPAEGQNVPGIRFPQFAEAGEWKETSLQNISIHIIEKVGTLSLTPLSISAGQGFVAQSKKFGRDISGNQYKNYIVLRKNDFAYNKGNSKKFPQGCIYFLNDFTVAAVPNAFICFRLKEQNSVSFYQYIFEKNTHGSELKKYITSGARSDGLLNVNVKDFFSIQLPHTTFKEQQKIADCLTSLDALIAIHIQKLDELKEHKKGLMQGVFPKSRG